MPKSGNIRWRDSDLKNLRIAVQQFNAKRTRELKKHPELANILPDKISVKEVKASIATRADFNREVNRINRFRRKNATDILQSAGGVKATRWEVNELRIKVGVINRQRAKKRKEANVSTEKGTMGTIRANSLLPKKFDFGKMEKRDWDKFRQIVEKQAKPTYWSERDELYKENYIWALIQVFGEEAAELIDIVVDIPPDQLVELYYNDPILQLDFIYDPLQLLVIKENMILHFNERGYYGKMDS